MRVDEHRSERVRQSTLLDPSMVKHDGLTTLSQSALNPPTRWSPIVITRDSSPSTQDISREVKRKKLEHAFRGSQFLLGTTRTASPTHDRTDRSSLLAGLKRKRRGSEGGGGGGSGSRETAQSGHDAPSPTLRQDFDPQNFVRGTSAPNGGAREAEKHPDRLTSIYLGHTNYVPQADIGHSSNSRPPVPPFYSLAAGTDHIWPSFSKKDTSGRDIPSTHSRRSREERSNEDLNTGLSTHQMAVHSTGQEQEREQEREREREWTREMKQHDTLRQQGAVSFVPPDELISIPTGIPTTVREHKVNYTISDDRTGDTAEEKRRLLAILMKDHRGGFQLRVGINTDDRGTVVDTSASVEQQLRHPRSLSPFDEIPPSQSMPDFTVPDSNAFNLDFSTLDNADVLENFDFDKFLNTSSDQPRIPY